MSDVTPTAFAVEPSPEGERPGAHARFPYDRELVQRFRESFPRARWREAEERWWVPGPTAARRLGLWIARELETLDRHADARGRDAHAFDPLPPSPYLSVDDDLAVRTPFSRRVVERLREVPFARWDPSGRLWRIPFRSYEALKRRWPEIEAAAREAEPAMRRLRREEARALPPDPEARWRAAERRRRRYPVPGDDLPPLDQAVSAPPFGVVVFESLEEEPVEPEAASRFAHVDPERIDDYRWARWRAPDFRELAAARRRRFRPEEAAAPVGRGWHMPRREEVTERFGTLRAARRRSGWPSEGTAPEA